MDKRSNSIFKNDNVWESYKPDNKEDNIKKIVFSNRLASNKTFAPTANQLDTWKKNGEMPMSYHNLPFDTDEDCENELHETFLLWKSIDKIAIPYSSSLNLLWF